MPETKDKPAGPATKGARIVSRPPTFRRAGLVFTAEARVIPLSELTENQLEQLANEPNLVVTQVDIEQPKDEKKGAK